MSGPDPSRPDPSRSDTASAPDDGETDDGETDGGETDGGETTNQETDGRRRRGARRRAALLEATVAVIARDGVAGVTHRAVAAEAGVGKSAVTHQFSGLDDLLVAALRADTEELVAALPDGAPDVAALAGELVRFAAAHHARVLVGYELYLLAARRPALRPAVEHWLTELGTLVGRHTDDPVRAHAAVTVVDGYLLQALTSDTEPDATELSALLTAVLPTPWPQPGPAAAGPGAGSPPR